MKQDVWIAIAALTVICFAIKAAGPVALGGRDLPRWADQLIALVPAALLPALIVVETFTARSWCSTPARPGWRPRWSCSRCAGACSSCSWWRPP
jgi:branched-subunit amino acid transport protein